MQFLTLISSFLWFLFGIIVLSASMSIIPTDSTVSSIKFWLLITSLLVLLVAGYLFFSGIKMRRRKIEKRIYANLRNTFMHGKFEIPLIIFAMENKISVNTAHKFIEKLVVPFRGNIDITTNGIIVYKVKSNNSSESKNQPTGINRQNGRKQ